MEEAVIFGAFSESHKSQQAKSYLNRAIFDKRIGSYTLSVTNGVHLFTIRPHGDISDLITSVKSLTTETIHAS